MHRRPTTRPTVCRESAEITRDQWGAKRIFMPVLPLRWDEAGARADVAQRQFRVFDGGCQRHGEKSGFRQDKMSHFLHVKGLQPGLLPRSSLALLLLHRDTEHPRLALGLEPVALALDVDRCRVV